MNVIAYKTIKDFYGQHPISKEALRTWYTILLYQTWKKPQDALLAFEAGNVDILRNNRLCIDVKGQHLRVIIRVNYKSNTCFIRWIGWHKDYDKLKQSIHTI